MVRRRACAVYGRCGACHHYASAIALVVGRAFARPVGIAGEPRGLASVLVSRPRPSRRLLAQAPRDEGGKVTSDAVGLVKCPHGQREKSSRGPARPAAILIGCIAVLSMFDQFTRPGPIKDHSGNLWNSKVERFWRTFFSERRRGAKHESALGRWRQCLANRSCKIAGESCCAINMNVMHLPGNLE